MLKQQELPEWRIRVYGEKAISGRKIEAFAIADLLADVVAGRPSNWGGVLVRGAAGNNWSDWGRLGKDLTLSNVGFARFLPDGSMSFSPSIGGAPSGNSGVGGFYITPSAYPLKIAGGVHIQPAAPPNNETISWTPVQGEFDRVIPLGDSGAHGIINNGEPAQGSMIATSQSWELGRPVSFDLLPLGAQLGGGWAGGIGEYWPTETIIQVGESLRVAYRQFRPPTLERKVLSGQGAEWATWKVMEAAGECRMRGERYENELYVLGGRLVWTVNGHSLWALDGDDSEEDLPEGASRQTALTSTDASKMLGGVPLSIQTRNLRTVTSFKQLSYNQKFNSNSAPTPVTGSLSRTVNRNRPISSEMLEPVGVGFQPPDTELPATASVSGSEVQYNIELTPSPDGYNTPFLTQVYLSYAPTWTQPLRGDYIDISRIVKRAVVSHGNPPIQAGTEGSITVDVSLMKQTMPEAEPYLKDYRPVEIAARWGTGDWHNLGRGYFAGQSGEQQQYNDATLTLNFQGEMMRLRRSASIVDGRCLPLDYYFHQRIKALDLANQLAAEDNFSITRDSTGRIVNAAPLPPIGYYGADAVQDIIRQFLGPYVADTFNGDGDPRRYLPQGHPPILSSDAMTGSWMAVSESYGQKLSAGSLAAQGGSILMPPFGQDALAWCNLFAESEFCVFTEARADRSRDGWAVLMYGERENLIRNAILHEVSGLDPEKLLSEAVSVDTKPENDINRVLVLCNPYGKQIPFAPAMIQGEARLPPSHPRSAENTWDRTLVLETPYAVTPERAQAIAAIVLMQDEGSQRRYPRYTILGDATCFTGDVFSASDVSQLGIGSTWFRAAEIGHEYTVDGDSRDWVTTLALEPMSDNEREVFRRTQMVLG